MNAKLVTVLGAILDLAGIALFVVAARRYRTAAAPGVTWNVRNWKPIWNQRDRYTPPGFTLMLIGYGLMVVGSSMAFWMGRR